MNSVNQKVLDFYKELPFNIFGDLDAATNQIKKNDPLEIYTELKKIIGNNNIKVLDVGCGGGWLVNSLSFHHKKLNVVGVDFNPVVIEYAKKIKKILKLNSEFYVSDLFSLDEKKKI